MSSHERLLPSLDATLEAGFNAAAPKLTLNRFTTWIPQDISLCPNHYEVCSFDRRRFLLSTHCQS
jgi:hypothetical protein